MEADKKKRFMKMNNKIDHEKTEDKAGMHEILSNSAQDRAHKVHKASASHKTIRQSLYGHKE